MASVAITERGDCLTDLGRLEEAAAAYEEAIRRDEAAVTSGYSVNRGQLGTVRLLQQRYDDALAAYQEARAIFHHPGRARLRGNHLASNRHGAQTGPAV